MAFTSGQWGPDTFIDSAGNTVLIGATVTASGYVCTVDELGNLTVTGPASDEVELTVTPATGAAYTQSVPVRPLAAEIESKDAAATAAAVATAATDATTKAAAAQAAAIAAAATDATTKANAAQAAAQATAAAGLAAQAASDTATYQPLTRRLVSVLGDSITVNALAPASGDGGAYHYAFGYWPWADAMTRSRFTLVGPTANQAGGFGAAGLTVQQLIDNGHVALAAAADTDIVVVAAGTNDVGADASAATILSRLQTVWSTLRASGKVVVATTIPPRNDTAGRDQVLRDANKLIRAAAKTTRGVVLCDWYAALVDPSTGKRSANLYSDTVHPTDPGASRMGACLAEALTRFAEDCADPLGFDNVDTTNLLPNGFMLGDSSGLATGWTLTQLGAGGAVASKVARTDQWAGDWQQVALTAASPTADGYRLSCGSITSGYVAGDKIQAAIEFETDATGWNCRGLTFQVYAVGATSYPGVALAKAATVSTALYRPRSGVLRIPTLTVPASPTSLLFQVIVYGTSTIRFGRAHVRKGTTAI